MRHSQAEVLLDRKLVKNPAILRYMDESEPGEPLRRERRHVTPVEADDSPHGAEQSGDYAQRGGLPGSV